MLDAASPFTVCPKCDVEFTPSRSNQTYCSRSCQKHASRKTRAKESRSRSARHYERTQHLSEMIYASPPGERLGTMQHILSFIPSDTGLRNILTDPVLLSERPTVDGRLNIVKAADAYTKRFYGLSIATYVRKLRAGDAIDPVPVTRSTRSDPVPNLRTRLTNDTVKCIHKPLSSGPSEQGSTEADFARVDASSPPAARTDAEAAKRL